MAGEVSHESLEEAVEKLADDMRTLLGVDAVVVDGVIYCDINGETHTVTIEVAE